MIFELKKQIELSEQSVGSSSRRGETTIENMDVSKELEECKAMVIELGADKSFLAAELNEWKESEICRRKFKSTAKTQVLKAFKWKEEQTDPQLLRAVSAFWEAYSERSQMGKAEWRQLKRKSKKERMIAWKYVTEYGWDGEMAVELESGFVEKRRFSAVDVARASDLDSNFNLKVVSDLNKCDAAHKKYARDLLPSETTCRRIQDRVHRAAVRHG
jgi:hypothetical protein